MINRIKSIQLNNFKFFQDEAPLLLEGKNLLLYGENGSGKSSIYWAIFTLFEASLKTNENDIKKYFSKKIKIQDNLINIHALEDPKDSDNFNSFIEVKTSDNPELTYRISQSDTAINQSIPAQTTNFASDFINYRMIMGFTAFRHSAPIDLFRVFTEDVFKYVQFAKVQLTRNGILETFTSAFEIWKQIEQGHEIVNSKNSKTPRKIRAYKWSKEWHQFEYLVKTFNESLKKLIEYINVQAPIHFKQLGYDFTFYLELEREAYYNKAETSYWPIPFIIRVKIPEYEHQKNAVHKPHSFLNEAKTSALAIAIRLAILTQKRQANCLKFIVLDDLLISLDMRNREKVLELLLSDEFVLNYQILILTHDKMFYEMVKHKINILEQSNAWKYVEMYGKEDENGNSKPDIKISKTYYEKAVVFRDENNLPESANNLRKAGEEFCKRILSKKQTITEDYSSHDLSGMIEHCVLFAEMNNLQASYFHKLDKFRKFILNSGSHDDCDTPFFKSEIADCLKIFKEYFNKIKIKHILQKGTQIVFELTDKTKPDIYRFEIILNENLRIYKEPSKNITVLKVKITYKLLRNEIILGEYNEFTSLQKIYDKPFSSSDKKNDSNYLKAILIVDTKQPLESVVKF